MVIEQSEYDYFKALYNNRATTTPTFANIPDIYKIDVYNAFYTTISDANLLTAIQSLIALDTIPNIIKPSYTVILPDISTISTNTGSQNKRIVKKIKRNLIKFFS